MRASLRWTRCILIAVFLSCLVGKTGTAGDFIDGNNLLERCSQAYGTYAGGFCDGLITGVAGAFNGMQGFYCLPSDAKVGEVLDIVKLYLRDHPERRNDGASSLIFTVLKEKFPCQ